MIVSACLIAWTFSVSQGPPLPAWTWGPRLTGGQELVYQGSFTQETCSRAAKNVRRFQVESRVLILETLPTGTEVALLTITEASGGDLAKPTLEDRQAVHLSQGRVDLKGRITLTPGAPHLISPQGPPEIEAGCFVELPADKTESMTSWTVKDASGSHQWRVAGTDTVDGQLCLKLLGNQQSEDWEHPGADRIAWRQQDTVWLSPQTGVAVQYEREIECRKAANSDCSQHSKAKFHLESSLVYPRQLFRDRQAEINLFRQYSKLAEACLREPTVDSPRRLAALASKIAYHCETQPPTPYRASLETLQRRLELAARGELPPIASSSMENPPIAAPTVAAPTAPDFVATDLTTGDCIHLQLLRGRPVLVLFYHPRSPSSAEALLFAQSISRTTSICVLGLSVLDESTSAIKQRNDLSLTFPLAIGAKLQSSYGVDSTPKIVLVDREGMMRRTFEGWGRETPSLVREEIDRLDHPEKKRER
jgi:peroxiredoxin